MENIFPYLTGRALPDTAPAGAMRDVSQDVEPPLRGATPHETENFDDDADTQDFVFPNLEQDLAPETRASLAQT